MFVGANPAGLRGATLVTLVFRADPETLMRDIIMGRGSVRTKSFTRLGNSDFP